MEERATWLTNKQADLRSLVSKEDYINWLQLNETKMLFLQLDIDLEELKDNWAASIYEAGSEFAQGQAAYIIELEEVIRNPYNNDEVEIDDES